MRRPRHVFGILVSLLLVGKCMEAPGTGKAAEAEQLFSAPDIEFFEKRVRPLLAAHCYSCHSADATMLKGGLRLDSRAGTLAGGDSGAAVIPGKSEDSLLVDAVQQRSLKMPPEGKLTDTEIAILVKWIQLGAPWPAEDVVQGAMADNAPQTEDNWNSLRHGHWAFQPVKQSAPPMVRYTDWPQNEIDYFVLARLEAVGIEPAHPAAARTLLRRMSFDLIGLPPTPEGVEKFVAAMQKNRQVAVSETINRLLASPHYGERWGRHWLDVARYSEGKGGSTNDDEQKDAWKYRDWVIEAFNRDLPYDEFVKHQIAGNQIPQGDDVARGFLDLGPNYKSDGDDPDSTAQAKAETLDDRVDTLSRGLLAVTLSCARCHDHKFDPIPQQDYYSIAGVLHEGKDMKVAVRGNLLRPGELAPRRFLRILAGNNPARFNRGDGRLDLAEAVADLQNPLTARVFVNRVWMHHFGKAIVRTPSNFGVLGEKPTHPQLLDWLATDFVRSGWSVKGLHRKIMHSATYQMSSRFDQHASNIDGDNQLLWQMNPRRLDVEAWRDAMLAVTGELDRKIGGDPITDPNSRRRTVYFKVSRNGDQFALDEFLQTFDFPLMRATIAKRPKTIVPQQFLFILNSSFITGRAQALAARLAQEASADPARIERAYVLLYGRLPTEQETELGLDFLTGGAEKEDLQLTLWQRYAQVLLGSNELMYLQ